MPQMPSEDASAFPQYLLAQMVSTPLKGQQIGTIDSSFVIAEWADPGAPAGPPRYIAPFHVHYADDEAWYILEGTMAFRLGDQEVLAPTGSAVFAPRGVPHTYWNPQPTAARYLLIMTPAIRRLIDEIHETTDRSFETMQALYQRYNSALVPLTL